MSDISIGGLDLTFDLERVTWEEYQHFALTPLTDKSTLDFVAQVTGEPVDALKKLSQPNFRRVVRALFKKANEPLSDPT